MSEAKVTKTLADLFLAKRLDFSHCFARLTLEVMHNSCLREYICR